MHSFVWDASGRRKARVLVLEIEPAKAMQKVTLYRKHAKAARELAETMPDIAAKASFQQLALQWERLANEWVLLENWQRAIGRQNARRRTPTSPTKH
jgi:hypothetical protein